MRSMAILLICAVTALIGCNKKTIDDWGVVKLNKETRYYNDYLGISYAIPRNWWLYEINEYNLSESKGDIIDDVAMDIDYGRYENYRYANVWFVAFGNLEESSHGSHLGFSLDARSLEGINDVPGFMEYFEMFMLEPADEEEYSLLESQQINIKGKIFELRDYLVSREGDDFNVMTLSCQIKQGYFFNVSADYWPDNKRAKQTIIDSITNAVEFY